MGSNSFIIRVTSNLNAVEFVDWLAPIHKACFEPTGGREQVRAFAAVTVGMEGLFNQDEGPFIQFESEPCREGMTLEIGRRETTSAWRSGLRARSVDDARSRLAGFDRRRRAWSK